MLQTTIEMHSVSRNPAIESPRRRPLAFPLPPSSSSESGRRRLLRFDGLLCRSGLLSDALKFGVFGDSGRVPTVRRRFFFAGEISRTIRPTFVNNALAAPYTGSSRIISLT
jgi:hypothetical protein